MNTRRAPHQRRRGVTLLEVMTAVALSATMMMSSFVVLRSTYAAWQAHEADLDRGASAAATLRHLTRCVRQSNGVGAISAAIDTSGSLTIIDAAGVQMTWEHAGTGVTLSLDAGASQPLADGIQSLAFEGYTADGVTPTTDPDEVQAIRAIVETSLPTGGLRTLSSFVWVRSW